MHNFADDNFISAFSKDLQKLIKKLKNTRECAGKWFRNNCMIVNPGKFQSITIERRKDKINLQSLKINNNSIETSENVKLLGIDTDNHLNFELHVSTICEKTASQLNASRLKSLPNQDQRNIIANSFIYRNFNCCPLILYFCSRSVLCDLFLINTLPTMNTFL